MIFETVSLLRVGGVVIFPTETVYALACDASNYRAMLRIYDIKQRNIKKNLPVMVAGISQLESFASFNESQARLIKECCPGPVTFILKRKKSAHLRFRFPEKVAVRVPDSKVALKILRGFNRPVFATSVNLSGRPAVSSFTQIGSYMKKRVSRIICDNRGVKGTASSIIDISGKRAVLVRKGAFSTPFVENSEFVE
ncbi:L-threonylcarbamoyladenylate synthase [Neorickettsia risticii]|uniref:L-threonylcarbamoyladenylate synthase n=1 Tax=Neorickettsia risticii (strain Illinois) TaxID=434131 RepID=C6V566_NEORI|nr:L-threonylcarbamoyladenylate synthase [Neorickettsia risticii]ACT69543.1 Sua5/YciO/YrdC/YwlC family protein [Neorickettsia risticii str. Illinois]